MVKKQRLTRRRNSDYSISSTSKSHLKKYDPLANSSIKLLKDYAEILYIYKHNSEMLERKIKEWINNFDIYNIMGLIIDKYQFETHKLKKEHPDLTETDILLSLLIAADFTNQQICALVNLKDVRCLYVKKSRLKEKLDIDESLGKYLRTVLL